MAAASCAVSAAASAPHAGREGASPWCWSRLSQGKTLLAIRLSQPGREHHSQCIVRRLLCGSTVFARPGRR